MIHSVDCRIGGDGSLTMEQGSPSSGHDRLTPFAGVSVQPNQQQKAPGRNRGLHQGPVGGTAQEPQLQPLLDCSIT
jgi:hypothetical protein